MNLLQHLKLLGSDSQQSGKETRQFCHILSSKQYLIPKMFQMQFEEIHYPVNHEIEKMFSPSEKVANEAPTGLESTC